MCCKEAFWSLKLVTFWLYCALPPTLTTTPAKIRLCCYQIIIWNMSHMSCWNWWKCMKTWVLWPQILPKINFFFPWQHLEGSGSTEGFQPFGGEGGGRFNHLSDLSAGLIIRIQIPIRQNHVQLMISENGTIYSPFDLHTNSWLKSLQADFVPADDFLTSVSIRKRKVQ